MSEKVYALDMGVSDVHIDGPARVAKPKDKQMASISTKKRNALPKSEFAEPSKRKYPVNDKAHADNAAARLEQQKKNMSPSEYAAAKAKVKKAQESFGEKPKRKKQLHVRAELADGGSLHIRQLNDNGGCVAYLPAIDVSDSV